MADLHSIQSNGVTNVGVEFDPNGLSLEQWRKMWGQISALEAVKPWHYGALFNAGRRHVDPEVHDPEEIHRQVAGLIPSLGECGLNLRQLKVYGWVAAAFPARRRHPRLSWYHHREVWAAGVAAQQQRKWLNQAALKNWSTRDLRVAMAPESRPKPETMEAHPVRFVARRWSDQGVQGFLELFPMDEPVDRNLLITVRREIAGVIAQLERIGLVGTPSP